MKKGLVILILLVNLFVGGCKTKELTVIFEDYGIYDIKESKDITERISVSIESNDISKIDINSILDKLENRNMNTEIIISNIQGVKIAEAKEINKKINVKIKEGYECNDKSEVKIKGIEVYKEYVSDVRSQMNELLITRLNEYIELYNDIASTISENLDGRPATIAKVLENQELWNIDHLKNQSKDFLENVEVKKSYDKLMDVHFKFKNLLEVSENYRENERQDDLEKIENIFNEFKIALEE